ncbi:TspO MBR-related protein [Coniophora puteana RWD-64-598 SS2]|uniref:TspO MBR-related protein n=1 Tax=Coniophora puteana (strain RWD-64-598) TaxID=741705 RepID=A0A5M3MTQ0_CONPW|nr:TspO MBR-related protein [Coniophora puteana RWD-64-598 SS2]EIW82124.1 TspO MBR-related protein [Coniophora puteana RWD-64-598 SS2]
MPFIGPLLLSIPRNVFTAVGIPLTLGFISGSQTRGVVRSPWYKDLPSPPGRPSPKVFPVAWSLLYLAMGYASHIIVKTLDETGATGTRSDLTFALKLYYAQLTMNVLWSPLFFGLKQVGLALVDSAFLTGTTLYMTNLSHGLTRGMTSWFLVPYCTWLCFATYLNGGTWLLLKRKGVNRSE